ncbi:MAG: hypothetical protein HOQ02_13245 [Lysobacter sp.]|nr:hypothetical protein [Lysobacter sp.]
MHSFTAHPTREPLPWPDAQPQGRRRQAGEWTLTDEQVASFDALLHEVCPQAPRVQADQVAQLARWLLSLPPDEAQAVLAERLVRMDDLRALLDDPDWDRDSPGACRLRGLLAYFEHDGLIPNHIPVLGRLDDVLLLELAWPGIASEVDDYLDFREYRTSAQPDGDGPARRSAWTRERLSELAWLQQRHRVGDSHYAPVEPTSEGFRIR